MKNIVAKVEQLLNESKYIIAYTTVFDFADENQHWIIYGCSSKKQRDERFKLFNDGMCVFEYKVRVENGQVIINDKPVTVEFVHNWTTKEKHRRQKQILEMSRLKLLT